MTARELYINVLTEINKVGAPSLLLEDFVYFANKACQQYTNKVYTKYEMNQQATDDLVALHCIKKYENLTDNTCNLDENYLHLLNCIIEVENSKKNQDCKNEKDTLSVPARKITADQLPQIQINSYFKPSLKRPYYRVLNSKDGLKLQILCGEETVDSITIEYIKKPELIELDYEELENPTDNSTELEFSEYVCFELVNEIVKLVLENSSDPRLQTNVPINMTIPNPAIKV